MSSNVFVATSDLSDLGKLRYQDGDYEGAIDAYKQVVKLCEDNELESPHYVFALANLFKINYRLWKGFRDPELKEQAERYLAKFTEAGEDADKLRAEEE